MGINIEVAELVEIQDIPVLWHLRNKFNVGKLRGRCIRECKINSGLVVGSNYIWLQYLG
jgi:hypothetical protein